MKVFVFSKMSWTCLSFAEWLCYLAHWRAVPLAWVIAPPLIPHQPVITNLWRSVATSWKSQQSVVSCSVVKPRRWLPSVVCRATVYQFRPLPVGWTPARDQALIRGSRPPPAWERRCRSPSCPCSCTPLEEDQDQQGNSIPCQRSFCYLVTFPQMLVPLITIYWHRCPQKFQYPENPR